MLISVVLTVVLLVSYSSMAETASLYTVCVAKRDKCEKDCERYDTSVYRTGCKYRCAIQFFIETSWIGQ
ncbi:hypothetical protein ScPMuIL_014366 [Solemya velum]